MKVYIKIFQTLSKQKNILRRSKKYFHSVFLRFKNYLLWIFGFKCKYKKEI